MYSKCNTMGLSMAPNTPAAFRLDPAILAGLRQVKDRDGLPLTTQVDRALRAWLASKGIDLKAASRRASTRRKA